MFAVEGTAEWRVGKASEYPEDAERNLAAAGRLTRLAQELRAFEGSALHRRLATVLTSDIDADFTAIISHATSDVGFRSFPKSGDEFLTELLVHLEFELAFRQDSSESVAQSSESLSPSAPTGASVTAERIMIVVGHLRLLRINSLAGDIATLEAISKELTESSASEKNELEHLVKKALAVLGGVFDALGSDTGAQVIVSGAVAGLLGAVGASPNIIFAITMAAWKGKDAFLRALASLARNS